MKEIYYLSEPEFVGKIPERKDITISKHHIWCNGHPDSPVETCKWCSGELGLLAKYPMDCSLEELVKKHFPNVIIRDIDVK